MATIERHLAEIAENGGTNKCSRCDDAIGQFVDTDWQCVMTRSRDPEEASRRC
jgi:hypothetical protein